MTPVRPGPRQHQLRRVLELLQQAGPFGVCLADAGADGYTLRNRCGDLAAMGWAISSQRCSVHRHEAGIHRYYLTEEGPHDSEPTAAGTPTPPGNATPAVGSPNPTHFGGGAVEMPGLISGSRAAALPAAQTPELFPAPLMRSGHGL